MARVELTRHLLAYFPKLQGADLQVQASTVREVVRAMDEQAPGIAFYICDELGRLRRHVNIFVDGQMISDRGQLSDRVASDSHVLIMQALSGG